MILRATARRKKELRPNSVQICSESDLPKITIVVPAHNEAKVIASKVENLSCLVYPRDRLNIVFALDGCTDNTRLALDEALEAEHTQLRVTIFEHLVNRGKIAVINEVLSCIDSGIVALTDASAHTGADALVRASSHFLDDEVGVVCGTYSVATIGSPGERRYWDYQTEIKFLESVLAAPMGAHGAFYLFRRELSDPIPLDTINDDFVLPMSIHLKGRRLVYDREMIATEIEPANERQEFRRRVRIGAGNLQQAIRLWRLSDPRLGWTSFLFLSGKGLRAFVPFLLALMLLSSLHLALAGNAFYQVVTLCLVVGVVGCMTCSSLSSVPGLVRSASYLVTGHVAGLVGSLMLLCGLRKYAWSVSMSAKGQSNSARDAN